MSAITVTGKQVLFRIAAELDEIRYGYVETVNSQTSLRCPGISADAEFFKHGLAQVFGNGVRGVSGYDPSTETITLSSAMPATVAAGDVLELIGWDAQTMGRMKAAINNAIEASYHYFYREVFVDPDRNLMADGTTTFTCPGFAADTFEYDLPSDCMHLAEVGWAIRDNSTDDGDFRWFPRLHLWRTVGEPGAMRVRFNPSAGIVGDYAGNTMGFHYEAREPALTSMDGTTRLPLDYFAIAAMIYKRQMLNKTPASDREMPASATLPFAQQAAMDALQRLGAIKRPLPRGPKTGYWEGGR